jgi:ferredoxin-type protein NapH
MVSNSNIRQKLLKFNTPRRIVQVLSFVLFTGVLLNLGVLAVLFPVLWTWGLKTNTVGDAFTAIQLMFSGWNLVSIVFPWIGLASFLIVGVLIGKALCGWMCPFGFVQDLVGYIRRQQTELSARTRETAIYGKYLVLALTLLISVTFSASKLAGVSKSFESALGIFTQAPFTVLSPSETLFAAIPRAISSFQLTGNLGSDILTGFSNLSPLFWVQFAIMVMVLVFAVYVPRSFCRYLCPHGAIMALMNGFSFIGLRREPFKCEKANCRNCVLVCPTRVPILELPWEKFSHPECIYCMKCVDACQHGAIKLTYP